MISANINFIKNSFLQRTPCVITDQDLPNLIYNSIHPFSLLVKYKTPNYIKYGLKYKKYKKTKVKSWFFALL